MQHKTPLLPLLAGLLFGFSAYAAPPAGEIRKMGETCESCCCCQHGEHTQGDKRAAHDPGIKKAGATCEKCGSGGCCTKGCCGGMKGMRGGAMMGMRKEHRDAQHALVGELKAAKSDAQRVKLMQRYIENMDAHMTEMMQQRGADDGDAHAGHEHGAPGKK